MAIDGGEVTYRVNVDSSGVTEGMQKASGAFENFNNLTDKTSEELEQYSQAVEKAMSSGYKDMAKNTDQVKKAQESLNTVIEASKAKVASYQSALITASENHKKIKQEETKLQTAYNQEQEKTAAVQQRYWDLLESGKSTVEQLNAAERDFYEQLANEKTIYAQLQKAKDDLAKSEEVLIGKRERYANILRNAQAQEQNAQANLIAAEKTAASVIQETAEKRLASIQKEQNSRKQASKEHLDQVKQESDAVQEAADEEGEAAEDAAKKQAAAFAIAAKAVDEVVEALKKAAQEAVNLAKDVVNIGAEFETSMAQVAATSGMSATDVANNISDYRDLVASAKEAGLTTMFSASQAGEALNYLALAGYNVEQSIETMPDILTVAAAGAMDLGRASDMVTDAMNALDLGIGNTTTFIDKMAKTAQSSNTNVEQLGRAILTVGGTATVLKGGVTELDTALGLMANSGIKASVGGVNLRNILLNLTDPTREAAEEIERLGLRVFDSEGNMRGLNEIFGDLNNIMADFTDEQRMKSLGTIFNTRQLRAVTALMKDSGEAWDTLAAKIDNSEGAAERMAETMRSNLNGALNIARSNLDAIAITLYEGVSKNITDLVREAIPKFQELNAVLANPEVQARLQNMSQELKDFTLTVLDKVVAIIPKLIEFIANFSANLETLRIALTAIIGINIVSHIDKIVKSMQLLAGTLVTQPWIALIAVVAAATAAFIQYKQSVEEAHKAAIAAIEAENDKWVDQRAAISDVVDEWNTYKETSGQVIQDAQDHAAKVRGLYDEYVKLRDAGQDTTLAMEALADEIPDLKEALAEGKVSFEDITKSVDEYCASLEKAAIFEGAKASYTQAVQTREKARIELERQNEALAESVTLYKEAVNNYNTYKNALENQKESPTLAQYSRLDELEAEMIAASNVVAANQTAYNAIRDTYDEANQEMLDSRQMFNEAMANELREEGKLYTDAEEATKAREEAYAQSQAAYYKNLSDKEKEEFNKASQDMADELSASISDIDRKIKLREATSDDKLDFYRTFFGTHPDWSRMNEDMVNHFDKYKTLEEKKAEEIRKQQENNQKERDKRDKQAADDAKKRDAEWTKDITKQLKNIDWTAKQNKWDTRQTSAEYKKFLEEQAEYYNSHEEQKEELIQKIIELDHKAEEEEAKAAKDAATKYVKEWETGYDKLLKAADNAYKELNKKREKFQDNLLKGVELYTTESGKVWNKFTQQYEDDKSMKVSAKGMKEQLKELQDYDKVLDKLRAKGVSDDLMSEILGMNPDKGKEFADALNKLSGNELAEYQKAYQAVHDKADEMTTDYYQKELEKFDKEYMQPLKEYVSGDQSKLKEAYALLGTESVQGYLDGLQSKAKEADDESKKIYEDALQSVKDVLGIHSPSTAYYEVGENVIEGFLNGVQSKAEQLANIFASLGQTAGDRFVNAFREAWDNFVMMWNTSGVMMPQAMVATTYGTPAFMGGQTVYNSTTATNYNGLTKDDIVSAVKEALPDGDVTLTIDKTEFAKVSRDALNSLAENSEMGLKS